ncbi:RNA 2'-phosphotransferase [Saccharibacillus alkalitolerans]|uniref:Probable RNA 2'-phosphotransferase n=1 Tax=Saccharibacillus alkalitolerans TaxID=2705290 RepID=A0ABX0F3I0_9BACL|nr:RNA 2'-phosphotransferase [Saccharibacillus alkalitolerans]NGZ75035.1 RNA 2'-phosphotransferase [Saccharibacillus alkalitolerans]
MGKTKKKQNGEPPKPRAGAGNPYRGPGREPKLSAAERYKKISKLMSMMLRHSPEEFGLTLDPEDGSCGLDELLEAVRRRTGYEQTTEEDIRGVVRRSDKQRFEIVENRAVDSESGRAAGADGGEAASERSGRITAAGGKPEAQGISEAEEEPPGAPRIRARYGHSFGRVTYPEGTPPSVLYHGTSRHALPSIAEHGLLPMGREYVHLSAETQFAALAGRRKGRLVMLRLDTAAASEAGVVFYDAGSGVWLAERIPPGLMDEDEEFEGGLPEP